MTTVKEYIEQREMDKSGLLFGIYFRFNGSPVCVATFATEQLRDLAMHAFNNHGNSLNMEEEYFFPGIVGKTK